MRADPAAFRMEFYLFDGQRCESLCASRRVGIASRTERKRKRERGHLPPACGGVDDALAVVIVSTNDYINSRLPLLPGAAAMRLHWIKYYGKKRGGNNSRHVRARLLLQLLIFFLRPHLRFS